MLERLLKVIIRLKDIFTKMEVERDEHAGNEQAMSDIVSQLQTQITSLEKDQTDALALLDELEEVIKKWE